MRVVKVVTGASWDMKEFYEYMHEKIDKCTSADKVSDQILMVLGTVNEDQIIVRAGRYSDDYVYGLTEGSLRVVLLMDCCDVQKASL
jgi:hypothetical protein